MRFKNSKEVHSKTDYLTTNYNMVTDWSLGSYLCEKTT